MKNRVLAVGGLAAILASATAYGVYAQERQPSAPAFDTVAFAQRRGRERHPEMMRALRELEQARADLKKAATDFGGHRVKALDHTNAAIDEVHDALNYDKK